MSPRSGLAGHSLMLVHSDRQLVKSIMVAHVTASYQETTRKGEGGGVARTHVRFYLKVNRMRQERP
jgi:hypothetical protein